MDMDLWKPWIELVDAPRGGAYTNQLLKALANVSKSPEHVKLVVAAALTVARVMVETEKGLPMQQLSICKFVLCERCVLGGWGHECQLGAYKKNKVGKALRLYAEYFRIYAHKEGIDV